MDDARKDLTNLSVVQLPDHVLGPIQSFKNYDPERIQHYEILDGEVNLYMNEMDRILAIQEYKSTIEAFRYEVDRRVRPETQSYKTFEYSDTFDTFTFIVNGEAFEQDVSALMIERSIVEDAIRFQLYSRKPIGVKAVYKDAVTGQVIREKQYPTEIKL